ncbi:hypothetical protein SPRG_14317 [Saprolegnia parasitica CBS 223.65]|uniref:Uncharacterized protein n=1 Tax=Saprolegnia parasitica (strain CBS 223.65) TaxID=695850 RepID=A0A067BUB9_SAPPC|nr:hypothetical protein SPRG_14317 [Saprolegnia parasitica CBS 223.65]KDO20445.1 hypothetical protein SPRG_14317 [Saprolegnia parasitica CBS 223.65]|eukprot:XP_012208835.1 hypothetical protein SPRG_14317 [Saprolegnia parasitica CBS 223.65]
MLEVQQIVAAAEPDAKETYRSLEEATGISSYPVHLSAASLQQRKHTKNLQELIKPGEDLFEELPYEKLEDIFYTWPAVMEQVMLEKGDNSYDIPHLHKIAQRATLGPLPQRYICSMKMYYTQLLSTD